MISIWWYVAGLVVAAYVLVFCLCKAASWADEDLENIAPPNTRPPHIPRCHCDHAEQGRACKECNCDHA